MLISVSTGFGDDPKFHSRFDTIEVHKVGEFSKIITSNFWSPIIWHDGRRRSDHFKQAEMLVLDFDSGAWTLDRARQIFFDLKLFHIIGTTRSHTPEKHRFRAIFVLKNPITDSRQYSYNIEEICKQWPADPACKDTARMFRKCTEIVYTGAGDPVIPSPYTPPPLRQVRYYEPGTIPNFIYDMLCEVPAEGNRNKHCFRIAAKLSELGHTEETCIDYVLRSNVSLPMSEKISAAKSGYRYGKRHQ